MTEVFLRRPHLTDIVTLATNMRPGDVAEVKAMGHEDMLRVVTEGVRDSPLCYTALDAEGGVLCILGVAPLGPSLITDRGAPWMLGTPELARHRTALMRLAPGYIAAMLDLYPRLENVVHAENVKAVAWLKRLGFVLAPAEKYGPYGALFHRFKMER